MKTNSENKTEVQDKLNNSIEVQTTFNNSMVFTTAIVAEVEYDNGTTGQHITFYNKDTNFENTVIGLKEGCKRQDNVTAVKFTVCSVTKGFLNPILFYDNYVFTTEEKITATNGSHFYYRKKRDRENVKQAIKDLLIENNTKKDKYEYDYSM